MTAATDSLEFDRNQRDDQMSIGQRNAPGIDGGTSLQFSTQGGGKSTIDGKQ